MTKIEICIFEKDKPMEKIKFIGYQAVELALIKLSEKFFSPKISKAIENILKFKRDGE